ncbi:MAG TPA: AI-2E family transporter [Candidatus Moranbacteria bacterium]|nr:AI-2E family transporter [Candidatus Moranbacteria bacterium]
MVERKPLEISTGIVLRTLAIVLLLWLLYAVRDIIALFFFSIILAATLDPLVDKMQKKGVARSVAVGIIYIALLGIISLGASFILPPLWGQVQDLVMNLPQYGAKLTRALEGFTGYASNYGININTEKLFANMLGDSFGSSGELFATTASVLHAFVSVVVVFSLSFYMLVKEEGMKRFIVSLTPKAHRTYVISLYERIRSKIGRWLFGQVILMLFIFAIDWAVLTMFDIPYALLLASIAGILEIVPYIGPIISAALAALVGLFISPATSLLILGLFTLTQQIESHVVVPQVMRKAVGLNPVVVILALLIGAKLGGTLGAILSIPLATAVGVFIGDIVSGRESFAEAGV